MTEPVRVAVVGVGAIGRHHARIYAEHPAADLVGVYDTDEERARRVAGATGTRAFEQVDALLERVDAVSVAVPTVDHLDVGLHCLGQGCDVLMEKPIAASLSAAEALIDAARGSDRVLQIGHVERYNPAVEAMLTEVRKPAFIEIHRLGSFAERSLEVDVVIDLMIHDIDIVHALVDAEIVDLRAVGVPVLSAEVDIANARLELVGGCTVNLTASRVSLNRVRKVRIFEPEAYFSVDYSNQQVSCFRLERGSGDRPAIAGVPVPVERREPLLNELSDFLACVVSRKPPRVTAADGHRALATALRIRDAIHRTSTA